MYVCLVMYMTHLPMSVGTSLWEPVHHNRPTSAHKEVLVNTSHYEFTTNERSACKTGLL